jgi:hypothetical protein
VWYGVRVSLEEAVVEVTVRGRSRERLLESRAAWRPSSR